MSSKLLKPEQAYIFRIIHRRNLPDLLDHGCLCRNCVQSLSYVDIGNQELIARRNERQVPCAPHGTLSDYVPFYFTPYSPMLYNIKTGYGVPQQPISDILILVSSLRLIASKGIPFVYSDRHAYLRTALFANELSELALRIAWKALQDRDFSKSDVDRFEKYQAEALVYKHVPLDAMHAIMCHNDSVKADVEKAAVDKGINIKTVTRPSWYL
jgi:ssDNA thymidine ADP-ribosyltransferase, DarT